MPSTYTLNNGIELIGTGEQSGTWGDTTNTNLELIDTALDGQVTVTLASAGTSGSPNALAISDGASSDGRNRMVIFNDGADLGATAYVQLTPNDAEKIVYIRNALSGSRSIIVFQGTYSASNDYEIPAGTTAVIYFNGGGAGAVAANVFNNAYFDSLRLGGVSVTAILDEDDMASDSATALATQQSIKAYVDAQVGAQDTLAEILANGNTTGGTDISVNGTDDILFGDNNKAIFGAGSDLQIYHDGSNSYIDDAGTGLLRLRSNQIYLEKYTGEIMAALTADAGVNLRYDNAIKLETTSTGVDVTGSISADGLTVDNGAATTVAIGRGTVSGDSSVLNMKKAYDGTAKLDFLNSATFNSVFRINVNDTEDVSFDWNYDDSIAVDRNITFTADGSRNLLNLNANGDLSLYEDTGTTAKLFWDASAEALGIGTSSPSADLDVVGAGGGNGEFALSRTAGATLFGQAQAALGRFGTSSNHNLQFITNSTGHMTLTTTGRVGIGTTTPATDLHIVNSGTAQLLLQAGAADTAYLLMGDAADTNIGWIAYENANDAMSFRTNNAEAMRIDSSGRIGIGTSSPSRKLDVSGSDTIIANFANTTASGDGRIYVTAGTTSGIIQQYGNTHATKANQLTIAAAGNLALQTSGSEAVVVNSSGNVGIGTSSPATALDVVGTVTADGLIVDANNSIQINRNGVSSAGIFWDRSGTQDAQIKLLDTEILTIDNNFGQPIDFRSGAVGSEILHARISGAGDIQFFEDTGTTAKFFWDASAEALGIGTSSPSDLLDISANGTSAMRLSDSSAPATYAQITQANGVLTFAADAGNAQTGSNIQFEVDGTERMRIDSSGNVGIGTSSPSAELDVSGSGNTTIEITSGDSSSGNIFFGDSADTNAGYILYDHASNFMAFRTNGSGEDMRIDSSGRVGIGTSSPSAKLHVESNDASQLFLTRTGVGTFGLGVVSGDALIFQDGSTERFRLDASGNLLVGKTAAGINTVGFEATPSGYIAAVKDGGIAAYFQRKTSDGDIVQFRKDGTTVGTIGTASGVPYFYGGSGFRLGGSIQPVTSAGALSDNTTDIGQSNARFKDLYLSGGVYLGGTGAANKLDDYEEGTFTPVVADAASGGNEATALRAYGYYTKIGRWVNIVIELTNVDTTGLTGTNDMSITGLPFAADNVTGALLWQGVVQVASVALSATVPYITSTIAENGTSVFIREWGDNTGTDTLTVDQLTSGAADIQITMGYQT